jgi:hypothetical protein
MKVVVELGERRVAVDASSLSPTIRVELLRRLYPQSASNARAPNVSDNVQERSFRAFPESFGTERGSEVRYQSPRELIHMRAIYLADLFRDRANFAWYAQVAARLRGEEIDEAVALARDVPASRLRTTRARYFTALVRDRVKARRNSPNPYAQPSTTP